MNTALISLSKGMKLTPRKYLSNSIISHWKFSSECSDIGGGLMPGAVLEIVEVQYNSFPQWIRVKLHGSYDTSFLKITGGELAHMFEEI